MQYTPLRYPRRVRSSTVGLLYQSSARANRGFPRAVLAGGGDRDGPTHLPGTIESLRDQFSVGKISTYALGPTNPGARRPLPRPAGGGNTPLVPVDVLRPDLPDVEVFAKMESLNPG